MRSSPSPLVVDYQDAREMYAKFLRAYGFVVAEARDGFEAVALASEVVPDVILMDLGLPRLDGWEATKAIKRNMQTSGIPVIAVTAYGDPESRQRAIAAGCASVIQKPADPLELLSIVNLTLGAMASVQNQECADRQATVPRSIIPIASRAQE